MALLNMGRLADEGGACAMSRSKRSAEPTDRSRTALDAPPAPQDGLAGGLSRVVERYNLADYLMLIQHPWRLIWVNLLAGMARGMGVAIGFSLLSAVVLYLLQELMRSRLPVISNFVADIVHLVRLDLKLRP